MGKYNYVSPEGQTNPGDTPWWQDPLNKVMDMVPESLQRGGQALEPVSDFLLGDNIDMSAPEGSTDHLENLKAEYLPQGLRDFGDFMGSYSALVGADPAGASGTAAMGPLRMTMGKRAREISRAVGGKKAKSALGRDLREGALTSHTTLDTKIQPMSEGVGGQYVPAHHRVELPEGASILTERHEKIHAALKKSKRGREFSKMFDPATGGVPTHPAVTADIYQKGGSAAGLAEENLNFWLNDFLEGRLTKGTSTDFLNPSGAATGIAPLEDIDRVEELFRGMGFKPVEESRFHGPSIRRHRGGRETPDSFSDIEQPDLTNFEIDYALSPLDRVVGPK